MLHIQRFHHFAYSQKDLIICLNNEICIYEKIRQQQDTLCVYYVIVGKGQMRTQQFRQSQDRLIITGLCHGGKPKS